MLRNSIKLRLAAATIGLFSVCFVSNSNASIPLGECEAFLRTGWLRFDRGRKMPGGPYKGSPLSAGTPSPALYVLNEREAGIIPEKFEEAWAVSNLVTKHGPSLALIPKVAPEELTVIRENEVDGTYHLMLRMKFPGDRKVRYWAQNFDGILHDPLEASDVVLDFGTHRIVGHERKTYRAFRGVIGHYALQARMGATEFRVRKVLKENRDIVEFATDLTPDQRFSLLEAFMARAHEIQSGVMYHTVFRNCATEFRVLFDVAGVEGEEVCRRQRLVHIMTSWTPSGLLKALRELGVPISSEAKPIEFTLGE